MNGEPPKMSESTTVVVIGASGFIGEHLVKMLIERKEYEVRVLVHSKRVNRAANISFVEGDLLKPESLDCLLDKNCKVINLAYLAQNNLQAITNLAEACEKNQVKQLIHCSTAVVAGRAIEKNIDEETLCRPTSEYQRTKLQLEAILLEMAKGKFAVSILRPTAVFGPGGKNLLKLANQLMAGNMWANYVRSCLFNRRSMNLVCVENVVAALVFMLDAECVDRETFIVSDDDVPINNYRDLEDRLMEVFGKSYPISRVPIPEFVLRIVLRISGRLGMNPSAKFSDQKIMALGLIKRRDLDSAIFEFANDYKISQYRRN